jgi:hypothetical protein
MLRNPTTGIADCCARAVIAQVAAPLRRVMKSRRCPSDLVEYH